MEFLIQIGNFILLQDFQVSFWSGIGVSAFVGFFVYQYTDIFKKPKLKLVVKQNGFYRDKILLSKRDDGDYEACFLFAIKNYGNKLLKKDEGYWHTYILDINNTSPFSATGESNHQRGIINGIIYPDSFIDIGHEWKFHIKKENLKNADVPYFFVTDYGYFPKSVKIDISTGIIPFECMEKISYDFID